MDFLDAVVPVSYCDFVMLQKIPGRSDPAKIVILKNSNDRRFDVLSRHVRRYGEYLAV